MGRIHFFFAEPGFNLSSHTMKFQSFILAIAVVGAPIQCQPQDTISKLKNQLSEQQQKMANLQDEVAGLLRDVSVAKGSHRGGISLDIHFPGASKGVQGPGSGASAAAAQESSEFGSTAPIPVMVVKPSSVTDVEEAITQAVVSEFLCLSKMRYETIMIGARGCFQWRFKSILSDSHEYAGAKSPGRYRRKNRFARAHHNNYLKFSGVDCKNRYVGSRENSLQVRFREYQKKLHSLILEGIFTICGTLVFSSNVTLSTIIEVKMKRE